MMAPARGTARRRLPALTRQWLLTSSIWSRGSCQTTVCQWLGRPPLCFRLSRNARGEVSQSLAQYPFSVCRRGDVNALYVSNNTTPSLSICLTRFAQGKGTYVLFSYSPPL